jgi:Zn-dependent oligopeptidase
MSENTQKLADRIAKILQGTDSLDFEHINSSLEKINQRLEKLEHQISNSKSQISNSGVNHASQHKFSKLEEIADEIIANLQNEKACPYEPTGKPCDHCSMCNSLGF